MKIHIIAVKAPDVDSPWVQSAWDEYTIDENPEGFQRDIEKAKEMHKDYEVRLGIIEVPDNFFSKIFDPPVVQAMNVQPQEASSA